MNISRLLTANKSVLRTELVCTAYRRAVRAQHNLLPQVKALPGSKSAANCGKFLDLCPYLDVPIWELMRKGIQMYPEDWCLRMFDRPYPPITVVTGEKTRNNLIRQFSRATPVTPTHNNQEADRLAATILEQMGRQQGLVLVNEGWPVDAGLRSRVQKILEESK